MDTPQLYRLLKYCANLVLDNPPRIAKSRRVQKPHFHSSMNTLNCAVLIFDFIFKSMTWWGDVKTATGFILKLFAEWVYNFAFNVSYRLLCALISGRHDNPIFWKSNGRLQCKHTRGALSAIPTRLSFKYLLMTTIRMLIALNFILGEFIEPRLYQ